MLRFGVVSFLPCWPFIKAYNGNPCGDSTRRQTGRCVHAAIVAVYIFDRQFSSGEGPEQERDGEMDGMEFGPDWSAWGDDGTAGYDMSLASSIQTNDPVLFKQRMAQLRLITSVYRFPVDEPKLKEGSTGAKTLMLMHAFAQAAESRTSNFPTATQPLLARYVGGYCSSAASVPFR